MDTIILSIRVAFRTPKVCKIVALLVVIMGLGRLIYILWGLDCLFFPLLEFMISDLQIMGP